VRVVNPALEIARISDGVKLSWSTNAIGFFPETSMSLNPVNWQPVTEPIAVVGSQNIITLTNPPGAQVFHLKR